MPPRRRTAAPPIDVDDLRTRLGLGKIVRVAIANGAQFPPGSVGRVRRIGDPEIDGEEYIQVELTVNGTKDLLPFAPADLDMAQSFANHAILALELSDARSNQERLAVLEDRDRIASDLHDHVIQRLFATGLTVQSAATMTSAPELQDRLIRSANELDETIRQIRYSIFELRENAEAASLRGTVLSILRQIGPLLAHAPEVKFSGPLDTLIDETLAADAGAVIREALTNVVRHAQAARTSVAVDATPDQLTISVTDDGIGLPAEPLYSGLANLRHRAERWGGELQLRPNIGSGTDVRWTVPLTTV